MHSLHNCATFPQKMFDLCGFEFAEILHIIEHCHLSGLKYRMDVQADNDRVYIEINVHERLFHNAWYRAHPHFNMEETFNSIVHQMMNCPEIEAALNTTYKDQSKQDLQIQNWVMRNKFLQLAHQLEDPEAKTPTPISIYTFLNELSTSEKNKS